MFGNLRSGWRSPSLGAALILGAVALSASGAFAAGDVAAGKTLFMQKCAVCHKQDGHGGVSLGDVKSADLQSPALEVQFHQSDAMMKDAIMNGKDEEGKPLDKVMPRWNGKITDAQADDLVAFLKTLKSN